jgi:aryl-alcohol dehydrogenase-like predicted oxidoreductase
VLASKGGMAGEVVDGVMQRVINGRPEALRQHCEDSLQRLGTDHIDLYYLHRWDKRVPIEDSVGAMAELVRAGKVRALGLSEVSATTLRRAHAEHAISAVQSEYSLWSRNVEIAVHQACREIGATLVAFSPVARAFLTGTLTDVASLGAKDIRRSMPRFAPQAYAQNLRLLDGLKVLAAEQDCTPAQLALAWLLARGDDVVPIPGTTQLAHLQDNLGAARLTLPAATVQRLQALFHPHAAQGARYNAQSAAEVDTEEFAVPDGG